jgi:hypothetical protein
MDGATSCTINLAFYLRNGVRASSSLTFPGSKKDFAQWSPAQWEKHIKKARNQRGHGKLESVTVDYRANHGETTVTHHIELTGK